MKIPNYKVQFTSHNKYMFSTYRELINRKDMIECFKHLTNSKNIMPIISIDYGVQYIKLQFKQSYEIYTLLNPNKEEYKQWQRDIKVIKNLIK